MAVVKLNREELHRLFHYENGKLLWKIRQSRRVHIGDEAGHFDARKWKKGMKVYRNVCVNGVLVGAHRVIYTMLAGEITDGMEIDHIDGNGLNNRIENLRLATHTQNARNRRSSGNNTSGFKGVSWQKSDRKWVAKIGFEGRRLYLGCFDTPQEAHAAYMAASLQYHAEFSTSSSV